VEQVETVVITVIEIDAGPVGIAIEPLSKKNIDFVY
jgi:hypothetical protein